MAQTVAPRSEAVRRKPSRNTRNVLISLTKLWKLWLEQKGGEPVGEEGPEWEMVHTFVIYMSNSRRQRSHLEPNRKGLGVEAVRLYTVLLCKSVLPSLYPRMVDVDSGGMGKGEYRAFVNDLLSAITAMFTEGGLEALAKEESERV